jgi:type VI secretion system secreted protein Hcp
MQINMSSKLLRGVVFVGIAVGMILFVEVTASTKSEYYLKIQGIKGNATEAHHKGWIDIRNYTHGIKGMPPSSSLARITPARTYGKAMAGEFTINKAADLASSYLSRMSIRGMRIPQVKIEQRWIMPDKTVYMVIVMQNVLVSSYQPSGSSGEPAPLEEVSFKYTSIEWEYTTSGPGEGREGGNIDSEWDVDTSEKQ